MHANELLNKIQAKKETCRTYVLVVSSVYLLVADSYPLQVLMMELDKSGAHRVLSADDKFMFFHREQLSRSRE
jgi:hypothetical protein